MESQKIEPAASLTVDVYYQVGTDPEGRTARFVEGHGWWGTPRWERVLTKSLPADPDLTAALLENPRDLLEEVWYRMNRIDGGHEWPELDRLGLRSMSTGDVVVLDGVAFIAAPVGWEPAPEEFGGMGTTPVEEIRRGDEFWQDGVLAWLALEDAVLTNDHEVRVRVQFRDGGRDYRFWDRGLSLPLKRGVRP